jgi:hypothetical protein
VQADGLAHVPDLFGVLARTTRGEVVDVLVTWIGGLTLVRYRLAIASSRNVSPLERRARVLVSTIALLLILRGISWLYPQSAWLGTLMTLPATLLPLAMALFVEGLLRRHLPLWLKCLAVVASGASLVATLAAAALGRHDSALASYVLLASLLVVMGALFVELARRDRTSLSRAENGLVRAMLVVAVVSVPLIATDFRFVLGWPPVRLGTLAALLFCYTLLRRSDERGSLRKWMRDLARLLFRAAVVCVLLLVALQTTPWELVVPLLVLAIALVLALAVSDLLRAASAQGSQRSLLRWLARPPATSLAAFVRELHHLPVTADAVVMEEAELAAYHPSAIVAAFSGGSLVRARVDLRADALTDSIRALGADELGDLLERTGTTHVALLSESPLRLLLANVPELPGAGEAELALAAVVRRGRAALSADVSHVSLAGAR